jgi:hypothetical protein
MSSRVFLNTEDNNNNINNNNRNWLLRYSNTIQNINQTNRDKRSLTIQITKAKKEEDQSPLINNNKIRRSMTEFKHPQGFISQRNIERSALRHKSIVFNNNNNMYNNNIALSKRKSYYNDKSEVQKAWFENYLSIGKN